MRQPICHVFQHVAFEDLGSFRTVIQEAGFAIEVLRAPIYRGSGPIIDAEDLLVLLGGPVGAYEEADYPFLSLEQACVREAMRVGARVLGVCLGAQIIARALGARVFPGEAEEIGYGSLMLTDAGRASPLAALTGVPVLHWHGDTFDLPDGAELLASTALYPHQAFAIGDRILGLQFHSEAQSCDIEHWIVGHTFELRAAGVDLAALRGDAARHGQPLARAARTLLAGWLGAR